MKFTVKTFCEIAADVVIGNFEMRHFYYQGLEPDGVIEKEFETWEDLIAYVRSFDYKPYFKDIKGPYNNFLRALMCTPNEHKRHRKTFTRYENSEEMFAIYPSYCCGYMVLDETGRVWDLRNYAKEIYAFDLEGYREKARQERREAFDARWAAKEAKWELASSLREGKSYWSYYRRISTTPERRLAANPEHKPFIRGRRSFANLPNSWDDFYFHREKNWKARNKKARKQYQVNKKPHEDTVALEPKWDPDYFNKPGDYEYGCTRCLEGTCMGCWKALDQSVAC